MTQEGPPQAEPAMATPAQAEFINTMREVLEITRPRDPWAVALALDGSEAARAAASALSDSELTSLMRAMESTLTPAEVAEAWRIADAIGAPGPVDQRDLRVEWWRAAAVLAALLYFTCSVAAAEIFGPEILDELRDNAIAAIAIYGALREWNKRQGR